MSYKTILLFLGTLVISLYGMARPVNPVSGKSADDILNPNQPVSDAYEPDNTPEQANTMSSLSLYTHSLSPSGDVDWGKLTIKSGAWSADFLASGPSDRRLRITLYDQNLNILESKEDDGMASIGRDCGIDPLPGGTYYLKAEEVYGREVDRYTYAWDDYEDCSLRPDLIPVAQTGFQYPVVPNSVKNTNQASSTLYAGKPTYFDWFFTNIGKSKPADGYYSRVWVGNYLAVEQRENGIFPGSVGGRDDWAFTVPQPGVYTVRIEVDATGVVNESNENNNVWERQFEWKSVNGWWAEFYNNKELTGDPVLVRDDPTIDFEWQWQSPGTGVNSDNFSARWTRTINFQNGVYRFNLDVDDGVAFYIDGQKKLDLLDDYNVGQREVVQNLSSGTHEIKYEMAEIDGYARAKLNWERCYSLTTNINIPGSGYIEPPSPNCGSEWYSEGTKVTLEAIANTGFTFSNWSGSITGSANPITLTIDGNESVTANFSQQCYTLTTSVSPSGGGTVSPSPSPNCAGGKYTVGTQVSLTANPASGYSFASWSGALTGSQNPKSLTIDGNKSVTANFSQQCYTLTTSVSPEGGGTVSVLPSPNCTGGKYTAGTQVSLTANSSSGYSFASWSGALTGSQNPKSLTIDGNKSVTANFSLSCITPGTPTLQEPRNGFGLNDSTPVFDWSITSNQNGYHFQLDNNSNFSSPIVNDPDTPSSSYASISQPLADGVYYWRVRAHNSVDGCDLYGDWTDSWSFIISTSSASFQFFTPVVLHQPQLCFAGPNEKYPNDNAAQANGPLCHGATISGLPEDKFDYFMLDTTRPGRVAATVSNHFGDGVQLALYLGGCCSESQRVDIDLGQADGLGVAYTASQPGRFYIVIYSETPKPNETRPYALQVEFP